jgi:hypothetical protein
VLYGRAASNGEIGIFGDAEGLLELSKALSDAASDIHRTLQLGRPARADLYDSDLDSIECVPGSGGVRIELRGQTLLIRGGVKSMNAVSHNVNTVTVRPITRETEKRFHLHIGPEISELFVAPDSAEVVVYRLCLDS